MRDVRFQATSAHGKRFSVVCVGGYYRIMSDRGNLSQRIQGIYTSQSLAVQALKTHLRMKESYFSRAKWEGRDVKSEN